MKKSPTNKKRRHDRERKAAFSMKKRLFLFLNETIFEENANKEILLILLKKICIHNIFCIDISINPGQIYQQVFLKRRVERSLIILVILAKDGDNYLDICLNLSNQPEAREEDLLLNLSCQVINDNF